MAKVGYPYTPHLSRAFSRPYIRLMILWTSTSTWTSGHILCSSCLYYTIQGFFSTYDPVQLAMDWWSQIGAPNLILVPNDWTCYERRFMLWDGGELWAWTGPTFNILGSWPAPSLIHGLTVPIRKRNSSTIIKVRNNIFWPPDLPDDDLLAGPVLNSAGLGWADGWVSFVTSGFTSQGMNFVAGVPSYTQQVILRTTSADYDVHPKILKRRTIVPAEPYTVTEPSWPNTITLVPPRY